MSFSLVTACDLEQVSFIAGTEQEFTFDIYTSGSVAMDLSSSTCTWEMARYGSGSAILTKNAIVPGTPVNRMQVILAPTDTASLSGKFIHQPVITTGSSVARPSQGIIQIFSQIS